MDSFHNIVVFNCAVYSICSDLKNSISRTEGCNTFRLWLNTKEQPQKIKGILLHRHDGNSTESDGQQHQMQPPDTHARKNINTYVTYWHFHTDPPPLFLWEVIQVQTLTLTLGFTGQKVCFPRFTPYYLFMKQRKREAVSQRGRETERNPPAWGLWCGKQNLLFNLASNGIHMTHPELVCTLCRSPFFFFLPSCPSSSSSSVCLLVCVRMRVHAHMALWCSHVCEIGGEWDNMLQIKRARGWRRVDGGGGGVGWTDKENISNRSMLFLNCSLPEK